MCREELTELNLDRVVGGTKQAQTNITQDNTGNKKTVQQTNVNGKNEIKVVQYNKVTGNKGNVKIGSPVNIEHPTGPIYIS